MDSPLTLLPLFGAVLLLGTFLGNFLVRSPKEEIARLTGRMDQMEKDFAALDRRMIHGEASNSHLDAAVRKLETIVAKLERMAWRAQKHDDDN